MTPADIVEQARLRAQSMSAAEAKAEAEKVKPHIARIARAHGIDECVLELIDDRAMVETAGFDENVIAFVLASMAMGLPDEHIPPTCNKH